MLPAPQAHPKARPEPPWPVATTATCRRRTTELLPVMGHHGAPREPQTHWPPAKPRIRALAADLQHWPEAGGDQRAGGQGDAGTSRQATGETGALADTLVRVYLPSDRSYVKRKVAPWRDRGTPGGGLGAPADPLCDLAGRIHHLHPSCVGRFREPQGVPGAEAGAVPASPPRGPSVRLSPFHPRALPSSAPRSPRAHSGPEHLKPPWVSSAQAQCPAMLGLSRVGTRPAPVDFISQIRRKDLNPKMIPMNKSEAWECAYKKDMPLQRTPGRLRSQGGFLREVTARQSVEDQRGSDRQGGTRGEGGRVCGKNWEKPGWLVGMAPVWDLGLT